MEDDNIEIILQYDRLSNITTNIIHKKIAIFCYNNKTRPSQTPNRSHRSNATKKK